MNDAGLFEATVPVFGHYVQRAKEILSGLPESSGPPDGQGAVLQRRLAPHAFSAGEHLDTALGFVARTVYPLQGREAPESKDRMPDRDRLIASADEARSLLASLRPADFDGSASRTVRHVAGTAELAQDATTFVTLFALPNFFFHLCMAFAVLRHEGVDVGKADFDGQHVYATGFRFPGLARGASRIVGRGRSLRMGERPYGAGLTGARIRSVTASATLVPRLHADGTCGRRFVPGERDRPRIPVPRSTRWNVV